MTAVGPPRGWRGFLLMALSVTVSVGLVAWLAARVDWPRAARVLAEADAFWLVAALVTTLLIPFGSVTRWRGVLRAQDVALPFTTALRAVLAANVVNAFVPSRAGEAVKLATMRRHGGLTLGVGAVALERLVDLTALGFLGLGGYLITGTSWGLVAAAVALGGSAAALLVAALLPFERLPLPRGLRRRLEVARQVFPRWFRDRRAMAQTMAGAACVWLLAASTVACLGRALDLGLPWATCYAVFPLASLAGLLPTTISGIGSRDLVFVHLLTASGADPDAATLVAFGYTITVYWILAAMGVPVVARSLGEAVASLRGGGVEGVEGAEEAEEAGGAEVAEGADATVGSADSDDPADPAGSNPRGGVVALGGVEQVDDVADRHRLEESRQDAGRVEGPP